MSSRGKVLNEMPEREYVNGKPVVHFIGAVHFKEYIDSETAQKVEIGIVYGVQNHPRLGRVSMMQPVYTSAVELKCEDGKSFETRNTFYRAI